MFPQDPDRQPRRDRLPGDPHLRGAWASRTVAVYSRGGRRRAARAPGRRGRGRSARRRRGESYLVDRTRSSTPPGAPAPQAIHPGYGFLSENADFAEACAAAGLVFIGPPPAAIRAMGSQGRGQDADGARRRAAGARLSRRGAGPGRRWRRRPTRIGYPVLIKAIAGGGGKGMRVVERADDLAAALDGGAARGRGRPSATTAAGRALPDPARATSRSRCSPTPTATCVSPVRARLLGPAPPPEGDRGSAGARHDAGAPRGDGRGRGRRRARGRLRRRRHGGVHRRGRRASTSWR